MKLYEIASAMDAVINGGFIFDDETGEVIFDSGNLDELEDALDAKLEACGVVVKNLVSEAEAIKAEEKRLAERRRIKEAEADRLKEYVLYWMEKSGAKKIDTARVALSTRKSSVVDVTDEAKVPREFFKVKTTASVDKAAVKKAIKAGEEVAGCVINERLTLQVK